MSATGKWIVGLLGALALGCAAQAQATTYYLTDDDCAGGCGLANYGTVDVTSTGVGLMVTVNLADGVYFDQGDNGHDAVAFDAPGPFNVGIHNVSGFFTGSSSHTPWNVTEGDLGVFQYIVDWDAFFAQGRKPELTTLSFETTATTLGHTDTSGQAIYFAVDIKRDTANGTVSGLIGAVATPPGSSTAVPEPASWAMLIAGFFGLGGLVRRRNAALAV